MNQPNRHSFCRFLGRDLEDKIPERFEANPLFTRKANETNCSRKLSNEPIPVNPRCEFEAFGELSGSAELTEDRAVEHVFGSMTNEQGGLYFRVIGLARTAAKIGLMNRAYNMGRLVQIDKLRASGV